MSTEAISVTVKPIVLAIGPVLLCSLTYTQI